MMTGLKSKFQSCFYCGTQLLPTGSYADGHVVCDTCRQRDATELIRDHCARSEETDAMALADVLMKSPGFEIHAPYHHYLVPAVLLTAYYNRRDERKMKIARLNQALDRAEKVPGGFCGTHGDCGACVGAGIFFSLVTHTTPFSTKTWQLTNRLTGTCLLKISEHEGPRCCKRVTFTSIAEAVKFANEHLNADLPLPGRVVCDFHRRNEECREEKCMYYPEDTEKVA
ncbi:MAG: DUF5714 domain-containing protein [Bacteroidales bacterium]